MEIALAGGKSMKSHPQRAAGLLLDILKGGGALQEDCLSLSRHQTQDIFLSQLSFTLSSQHFRK